jgi:hypothetical protein
MGENIGNYSSDEGLKSRMYEELKRKHQKNNPINK